VVVVARLKAGLALVHPLLAFMLPSADVSEVVVLAAESCLNVPVLLSKPVKV
jgi:hypothetical protein